MNEKNDKIQLYSLATPNGQKIGVALEEMEIPYDAHRIDISKGDQFTDEYKKINPNSKIPSIVDPNGPGGQPIAIMESAAILVYLAEKSGNFLSKDSRERNITLQWLFFQVGHIGPMFGQFGHFFKYAKDKCDHPYPLERYTNEAKRLLDVLDKRLGETPWLAGADYSIADMATFPWVGCLDRFYEARDPLQLGDFKYVENWMGKCLERPAAKRGLKVCA